MVYWLIARRATEVSERRDVPPPVVERVGPFESLEQAHSAQAARSRETPPRAPVRYEVVHDYA